MSKCDYCGEGEGTEKILDPNIVPDGCLPRCWNVCGMCKEVISLQKELSMWNIIGMKKQDWKMKKRIDDINLRLLKISKETNTPILNARIDKNINIKMIEFRDDNDR